MTDPSGGEGKTVARFPPAIWLRVLPLVSLCLFALGAAAAGRAQMDGAVLACGSGILALGLYLLDVRVYEVTEYGVRIRRFGMAKFFAFEDMGRLLGTEITQIPVIWTSIGTGRSTGYSIRDREGVLMFRVGLTARNREELLRRIREGKRRMRR